MQMILQTPFFLGIQKECEVKRLSLGGADRLSYRNFVAELARASELRYIPLTFPAPILRLGLNLVKKFVSWELDFAMFERMNKDLIVDNKAAKICLGFEPRSFKEALELDILE